MKYRIRKSKSNNWYLDLPNIPQEELKLSLGFDQLCDVIAKGDDSFYITMSTEKLPGSNQLIFTQAGKSEINGAWYFIGNYNQVSINKTIFLPEVIKNLFDTFPENIYFYKDF